MMMVRLLRILELLFYKSLGPNGHFNLCLINDYVLCNNNNSIGSSVLRKQSVHPLPSCVSLLGHTTPPPPFHPEEIYTLPTI